MTSRYLRCLGAASALLISMLTAAAASAQYPVLVREPDGPRFRGGINLEGGVLAVPGLVNLGAVGLQGQTGVQINNQWGVYATPGFDVLLGKLGGLSLNIGALVDWTPPGVPISVGLGPEVGAAFALGGVCSAGQTGGCSSVSDFGGLFYGGRLHFAYYPVIVHYPYRRRALAIGADVRFLAGAFGEATATSTTATAKATDVGISPVVYIGYTAF